MTFNQFNLNPNGVFTVNTGTGKAIHVNGNDLNNREIIQNAINSRLNFIGPQIGNFKRKFNVTINLTPIEQAEFDFMKQRITHLEAERNTLLSLVDKLKASSNLASFQGGITLSVVEELKISMKALVKASNIKELNKVVDKHIKSNRNIYNIFMTNFSSYGRLLSENLAGIIPKEDYHISLNQLTFSFLSLIDGLEIDDLKTQLAKG